MTLDRLPPQALRRKLADDGLLLRVGPFAVRIRTTFASVSDYVRSNYGAFSVDAGTEAHFTIDVSPPSGLRRWIRPQVVFGADGQAPFLPLPVEMAPTLFEWGFNWCVARRVNHLIVIHCAVVSRRGLAVLLPAPPESGKSTLCAALVGDGWDFASDEFAVVDPDTGLIHPLPRPISLKNRSIGIIGERWADPRFGPEMFDLNGGSIRYLRPPDHSVLNAQRLVRPRWIAIPTYKPGSPTVVEPLSRARMLAHLADSSYNFSQFGQRGLDCLTAMVHGAECFTVNYSDTDEALALFDRLSAEALAEAEWEPQTRNEDPPSRADAAA